MKKADGTLVDTIATLSGGIDGGGYVTGLDIAPDGRLASRDDCGHGFLRKPGDSSWTRFLRFGAALPDSEYEFKVNNCFYEIAIAPSNTDIVWAIARGRVYKSTDFGAAVARVMTFKGGATDTTFCWKDTNAEARLGGQHIGIDPGNANVVGLGHPIDGLYYTLDGGATNFIKHATLPAPLNAGGEARGINIVFDPTTVVAGRAQTVLVHIPGRGLYKSTTGIEGAYTLIAGSPVYSNSVAVAGGKIYVCGTGNGTDSQLYVYTAGAWTQPTSTDTNPVSGMSVCAKPGDSTKVVCFAVGGGTCYSADSGVTWTRYDYAFKTDAADVPWLATTNSDYMSVGRVLWDARAGVNRWVATTGIGVFTFDNPPRTALAQHYQSITLGIKQMLMMSACYLDDGAVLMTAQDRPVYRLEPGKLNVQVSDHGPDYSVPIRHGTSVDASGNYVAVVYVAGDNISVSLQGGKKDTWFKPANTPGMIAGNVAVMAPNKIVWIGGGDGPIKYTLDGGATAWLTPTFKQVNNSVQDMTGACWNHWLIIRRHTLMKTGRAGEALAYCCGQVDGGTANAALHAAQVGIWKTTDHGVTWVRIRTGVVESFGNDFYACKMRPVPGNPDHLFWVRGNANNYPTPPAADGLYFSINQGVNFTTLPGWAEVEDVALEPNTTSNPYPRIYAKGWRGGICGRYVCDNFDPANPTAATWTLYYDFPDGRVDEDCLLYADPKRPLSLIDMTASGGFYTHGSTYRMRAT